MQVCALPQSYFQRHQANIPWQSIHESNTVTFQEDGAHHREAVLNCKEHGTLEPDGFVSFPHGLETGRRVEYKDAAAASGCRLPEVFFAKRSGESLLDGKQPPIVLVVRAVTARTGAPIASIKPAVSNSFCVATRRVKGAMKVDIPSMDQEVRCNSSSASSHRQLRSIRPCTVTLNSRLTLDTSRQVGQQCSCATPAHILMPGSPLHALAAWLGVPLRCGVLCAVRAAPAPLPQRDAPVHSLTTRAQCLC